jgi:hypothetical protein
MSWISIDDHLPHDNSYVRVMVNKLFRKELECLFTKNYFIVNGVNMTKWVTYWKPSEKSDHDYLD